MAKNSSDTVKVKQKKVKLPKFNFEKYRPKGLRLFILKLLLSGIVLASLLYLVPDFTFPFRDKVISFDNLRGLSGNQNLKTEIPRLTETYAYNIESAVAVDKPEDWSRLVAQDQKNLERRVESYIGSNNYEVRLTKKDNKAFFTVYTPINITNDTSILTTSNSEFKVTIPSTTSATVGETESTPPAKDLGLKRGDFTNAELKLAQNTQAQQGESQIIYQVRLPLGLIGADKIKTINENIYSQLTVSVGGKDYSASFLPNSLGTVTHLVISSAQNLDEASAIRAYLNTEPYNLGYKYTSAQVVEQKYAGLKLLGLILLFILGAVAINKFTVNTTSWKKPVIIALLVTVTLALFKLLGLTVTSGFIIPILLITLLALFNARWIYYVAVGLILILIKILGYLYYFDLTTKQVVIMAILSLLIFGTNYVTKNKAKLA